MNKRGPQSDRALSLHARHWRDGLEHTSYYWFLDRGRIVGITLLPLDRGPTDRKAAPSRNYCDVEITVRIAKCDAAFALRYATADPLAIKRVDRNGLRVAGRAHESADEQE